MVMPRSERENLLFSLGYSKKDVADAVRSNIKAKNQRRRTVNNLPVAKMEETVETITHKLKKIVFLKKKQSHCLPSTVITVGPSKSGLLKLSN